MKMRRIEDSDIEDEVTSYDVKKLILRVCNLEDDVLTNEIADDTELFTNGVGLDPMDAIDIMFALRDEFEMKMPQMLIDYKHNLNTVSKIVEYINEGRRKTKKEEQK